MAFSITALQLVNQVHRLRRMEDTGAFVETQDLATLNAVNSAIEEILTEQKWEFDLRDSGQLNLKGRLNDSNLVVTTAAGSDSVAIAGDLLGQSLVLAYSDFRDETIVTRFLPTGVSDYANTAFRITGTRLLFSNSIDAVIGVEFPTTNTRASCELHYSEYILPDTVAEVVRAAYQEYPLTLEQVDPKVRYSEIFPRPHIEFGPPEVIAVGGMDRPTYDLQTPPAPAPGLRMAVWPVPDADYVINYSYYYRHPELVDETDVLDGVPQNVVNRIVALATSDMKVFYEKDYEAFAIRRSVKQSTGDMFNSYGGSRSARKSIGSWDTSSRVGGIRRGFPGKLLGG